jgi:5-methylcytosine-specific restriction endonuclease McrA
MTKRREFTKPVRVEILKRAERPTGFQCEACGVIVASGEVDHINPDGLQIDKSRKLTAEDGQFLCCHCHKEKTKDDKGRIAKAVRIEANRLGAAKPSGNIASRGFPKSGKTPAIDKSGLPPLQRKRMYQ